MVEVYGGSDAAESVRGVWAQVKFWREKSVPVLSGGTASDLLLGKETQPDGGQVQQPDRERVE